MAELLIEHTFEKIDAEGYRCTTEVNDTITIDFLSTGYVLSSAYEEGVVLFPDDKSIYDPFWKYLDKEGYEVRFIQRLRKKTKRHPVHISVDVIDKETGELFYLTAYSPELTEEEYCYFYNLFVAEFPDIEWMGIQAYIQHNLHQYLGEINPESVFDSDTADLLAKALLKTRRVDLCKPGFADFDPEIVEEAANEVIKEGLRFILDSDLQE